MRRRQFVQLIYDLRAELGRATEPSVSPADIPSLKRKISRIYETLYDEYDWPHLTVTTERMALAAGQRYYDLPDDIDFEKVERVVCWWNDQPHDVVRGIDFEQYATYDPEADDRTDPVLRWDVAYVSEPSPAEMLEVWPLPESSDATLQFKGKRKFTPLVNDADLCLLDDHIVIGFAAAELMPKDSNVQLVLSSIQQRLSRLKSRSKGGTTERVRLGLGRVTPLIGGKSVVRVSG